MKPQFYDGYSHDDDDRDDDGGSDGSALWSEAVKLGWLCRLSLKQGKCGHLDPRGSSPGHQSHGLGQKTV